MLYNRDYNILTSEEKEAYDKANALAENKSEFGGDELFEFHELMPTAGYHFDSFFPNNFLPIERLLDIPFHESRLKSYENLINDPESGEREVLNFIKDNEAYFIIASMLKTGFWFGHHEAYIFKEFELPPNFRADFVIVGKNSGGYEFIFVELESIYGAIATKNGDLGKCFRAGIAQIFDWDAYIEANYPTISLVFDIAKKPGILLPDEFRKLDKSRIHYAVISGRRSDFNDKTRRIQRKYRDESKIHLFHYDNLIDSSRALLKDGNF